MSDYYDEREYLDEGIGDELGEDYEEEGEFNENDFEENTDEYKTKEKDEEYEDFDDESRDTTGISKIATGIVGEQRDFEGNKQRYGMARVDDDDLGTIIADDRFKRLERMMRTPEDVFRSIVSKTVSKYKLSGDVYNEAVGIMGLINRRNRKLKYKNPVAVVFALKIFSTKTVKKKDSKGRNVEYNTRYIDKKKLDEVYEDVKDENITKFDILRYALMIESLRKK